MSDHIFAIGYPGVGVKICAASKEKKVRSEVALAKAKY